MMTKEQIKQRLAELGTSKAFDLLEEIICIINVCREHGIDHASTHDAICAALATAGLDDEFVASK